ISIYRISTRIRLIAAACLLRVNLQFQRTFSLSNNYSTSSSPPYPSYRRSGYNQKAYLRCGDECTNSHSFFCCVNLLSLTLLSLIALSTYIFMRIYRSILMLR
uniref:Uncharacterized protein n=1 Tax=Parascaris univalens TaxID=6257 RepID=A0A915B8E0_PARUN